MTDAPPQNAPRLWTRDGFREDDWTHAEDVDALSGNARIIVPLAAFLRLGAEDRLAVAERIGVHVQPGEAIDGLVGTFSGLALVSLAFPAFSDGRSYSKAVLLRDRYGFRGALRASGDVLIDQIPLMLRTGFTEFEVSNETALRRLEQGTPHWIGQYYQPSVDEAPNGPRFSWRRSARQS